MLKASDFLYDPNLNSIGIDSIALRKIEEIKKDEKIDKIVIGYQGKDNKVYYLRGGAGNEFGQASMPIYDANVAVLKEAFGPTWSDYCSEEVGDAYRDFGCSADGLNANANAGGGVGASGDGWDCYVYGDGGSYCTS